ncbi:hypothetical protein [Calothrix sp. NIES-2098]|uniref:hypothetical protein n=1 Tax=Calothrix sp. NIES-2098 TaxID=1954171 RepID=UPI000B60D8BA|nr:hypothetical protein NIES2098_02310 [Calothrix sp. NIES-2098]
MNRAHLHPKTAYPDSVIISIFLCLLTLVGFLQTTNQFLHWFLIPVTLCGILICIDAVEWFRGRLDIFSPVGVMGLLGLHFFFLAPLLHVSYDYWLGGDLTPPPDWRPWVGGMATLNLLGILLYRISRNGNSNPAKHQSSKTIWTIDRQRFPFVVGAALIICCVLQVVVYIQYGGLIGYINAFADKETEAGVGQGWLLMICESFPNLAMMAFTVYARDKKRLQSWPVLITVLIVFFFVKLLFGGLRGSRSNTVWALFWAAGMIHFWLKKISKKQILISLVFLILFMYFYGFLKSGGIEGVQTALQGQEARQEYVAEKGRDWETLVFGDLGRTDIHAYMLYRIMRHDSDYEYAWGRTYFAAFTILIPGQLWPFPEKPPNKSKEGTELLYGKGSFIPKVWVSSRVYGIAGETMLNFGPYAVPFGYIALGLIVGAIQRSMMSFSRFDTRLLLMPMLINFSFTILIGDLDNLIYFLVTVGGVPSLVLFVSSKKQLMGNLDSNYLSFDRVIKLKGSR